VRTTRSPANSLWFVFIEFIWNLFSYSKWDTYLSYRPNDILKTNIKLIWCKRLSSTNKS
jgi:hypothetical protein